MITLILIPLYYICIACKYPPHKLVILECSRAYHVFGTKAKCRCVRNVVINHKRIIWISLSFSISYQQFLLLFFLKEWRWKWWMDTFSYSSKDTKRWWWRRGDGIGMRRRAMNFCACGVEWKLLYSSNVYIFLSKNRGFQRF